MAELSLNNIKNPFTFAKILERWVVEACDVCGRGLRALSNESHAEDDVYVKPQWQSLSKNESKKQDSSYLNHITLCWKGNYCNECGRGQLPDNDNNTKPMNQGPEEESTVSLLHRVIRSWVMSGCASCYRTGNRELVHTVQYPMPAIYIIEAWRGDYCCICGLGGNGRNQLPLNVTHTPLVMVPPPPPLPVTSVSTQVLPPPPPPPVMFVSTQVPPPPPPPLPRHASLIKHQATYSKSTNNKRRIHSIVTKDTLPNVTSVLVKNYLHKQPRYS